MLIPILPCLMHMTYSCSLSLLVVALDLLVVSGPLVVKLRRKLSPHADISKLSITPCPDNVLLCLLCPPNVGVIGGDRSLPW